MSSWTSRQTARATRLVPAAVAAMALAAPASAGAAATVALKGGVLTYVGTDGADLFNVDVGYGGNDVIVAVGFRAEVLTPGTCGPVSPFGEVTCDLPERVVADLGGGEDTITTMDFPLEADLGPGDDSATSGGDADAIHGGPGRDTVKYSAVAGLGRSAPVSVTVGGGADDGEAGEGDDIGGDVEVVWGTEQPDRLVGDDGAQELDGGGGDDVLEGGGGPDLLTGSAGDDVLDGGAGDDDLQGNVDSDRITGGPGRDTVSGDGLCTIFSCAVGADQVFVRDGEVDVVDCGVGPDEAEADAQDRLAGCDVVRLPGADPAKPAPGPAPRPAPGPGPSPSPGPGAGAPAGQPAFRTVGVGLRTALRRGLPLRVTCPQSCDASATARIGAGTARRNRLGRRAMVVGRGRLDAVEAGRTATLTVRFTERARRRLRRARRVELAVTVAFATADGTATQARRVALNR